MFNNSHQTAIKILEELAKKVGGTHGDKLSGCVDLIKCGTQFDEEKRFKQGDKISFIFKAGENKTFSPSYTPIELLDLDENQILEASYPCQCSLNESVNHCEGDCNPDIDSAELSGYEVEKVNSNEY